MSRVAVHDISLHDRVFTAQWKPQHQRRANRKFRVRAHVKSANTNVSGASYAGGFSALEMNINNHSRALKPPALVLRSVFSLIFFSQWPSAPKDWLLRFDTFQTIILDRFTD